MTSAVLDAIYQRMEDDTEALVAGEPKAESELAKFYGGARILVSGATDLLGKCLLEKLLRDCPDLEAIYALVRVKKGEDFQAKCDKLCNDSVFDVLRKSNPSFKSKLQLIKADLSQDKLGLSAEDYGLLAARVDLIFHNGAARRLDEQVSVALQTNVLGTKRMLELARDCARLKAFVLVSTAFSHCGGQRHIDERFYRAPADLKTIADMLEADTAPSGLTGESLRMLLGDWPNVFSFGKAMAEELVQQEAGRASFACCVFRPSVVVSSYKEPRPGFVDAGNGPAQFFLKIAKGAIHVMHSLDYPIDLVPADLSVNAMLVSAWDAVDRWQLGPEAIVYNYGTSQERPITIRQMKEKIGEDPGALRISGSKRLAYVVLVRNLVCYFAARLLLDYLPALLIDLVGILHGNPPESWPLVRGSMADMCRLQRFAKGNWRVRMPEMLKACERLSPRDRELFPCDPRRLDWDDYFLTYWRGVRANVLGESCSELGDKRRRCCGCPCRCPCKCVCLMGMSLVLAVLAYCAIRAFVL